MSPEEINKASLYTSSYLSGNEEITTHAEYCNAFFDLLNQISENDPMFNTNFLINI